MAERALATAFVNIVPGTGDLDKYLKGKLGDDMETGGRDSGKRLGGGLLAAAKSFAGPIAAAFSFVAIKDFTDAALEAARAEVEQNARIEQIATSMGLFGDETKTVTKRLVDLAQAQALNTGLDEDAIKNTQAKLLTFKELAATADVAGGAFDRATMAAVDLAAAGFGSAESNAVALGKALNDPIKGVAALSRMGVQFSEEQKAMIASLVETGDMAGAQAMILKELETQVGGTAAATATSADRMEQGWANLQETVGLALLPVMEGFSKFLADTVLPNMTGLAEKLPEVVEKIGGAVSGVISLVRDGNFTGEFARAFGVTEDSKVVDVILTVRDAVLEVSGRIIEFAKTIPEKLGAAFAWVQANKDWILPLVVGAAAGALAYKAWYGAINTWQTVVKIATVVQAAFNAVMAANPIMLIVIAIAALVAGLVYFFTQTELGKQVWENMTAAIGAAMTWLWESVIKPVIDWISAAFTWLYENIILPVIRAILIQVIIWGAIFTWLYETIVKPVFDAMAAAFDWLWTYAIKPVIDFIIAYFKVWGAIFEWLYTYIVKPVFDAIAAAFDWVWTYAIKPVIDFIIGGFELLGEAIDTVFGAIADVARGAFEGLVGIVKGPINGLIDFINGAIAGINAIRIDIPEWAREFFGGATKLGFNIPKIPKLAEGGFVDSPTLAMIGEAGPEVVTPLRDFERMMSLDDRGGRTINYYAAPNQSIDSEQELIGAMRRVKGLTGW